MELLMIAQVICMWVGTLLNGMAIGAGFALAKAYVERKLAK